MIVEKRKVENANALPAVEFDPHNPIMQHLFVQLELWQADDPDGTPEQPDTGKLTDPATGP